MFIKNGRKKNVKILLIVEWALYIKVALHEYKTKKNVHSF